jgi:cytochrome b561
MTAAGNGTGQFTWAARILHWVMAVMVVSMLFIGVTMVASLGNYHRLVSIHRPLGIAIQVLVVVRFVVRRIGPLPPFLATMSARERRIATATEHALYALMFALPLVGWAMLSAARYPIALYGSWHLPPILPHAPWLYAPLRELHGILAYLLFATFLAHLSAVLFHTVVRRDGLLRRMLPWRA